MDLNTKLKEIRIEKKITKKDMAKMLNVDISTICLWEKNKRRPSLESVKKMISCNILEEKDIFEMPFDRSQHTTPKTPEKEKQTQVLTYLHKSVIS